MANWTEGLIDGRKEWRTTVDGVACRIAESGQGSWHWGAVVQPPGLPIREATVSGLVAAREEAEALALGCAAIAKSAQVEADVLHVYVRASSAREAESLAVCESRSVA